ILLLPRIFNRVVRRVASSYPDGSFSGPPTLKNSTLAEGLLLAALSWGLQGASLWALLESLAPQAQPRGLGIWVEYSASIALATVIGFLVITVPSGLGVRELLLQQLLAAELAPTFGTEGAAAIATVGALLLRLVWIIAEVT